MNNKTNHKKAIYKNESGKGLSYPVLTMEKLLSSQFEEDLIAPQFKLRKTEEELLIDNFGKLSIPTIPLNANSSRIEQV